MTITDKLIRILLLTLLFASSAAAQVVTGGGGGSGITQVSVLPASCTSTSGPVQLTVAPFGIYYCNGSVYVLSAPTSGVTYAASFGARGNWNVVTDGTKFTVTSGSPTVTCTTCSFTAADTGKVMFATNWNGTDGTYTSAIAVTTNGTTPITITFVNATTVTMSVNAGGNAGTTNANAGALAYGTDDTAANDLAKTAAYDGIACSSIQLAGPITNWNHASLNTASCPGISGGTTASKYTGIFGENPSGNTTILLPPWFDITNCTGATSGTACFGGRGGFFNVTFNGLGQSSFALGAHNLLENANDVSYNNVYLWGIAANSAGSAGMAFNGGIHMAQNIIVDGAGRIPCQVNGLIRTIYALECYNGTPTGTNGNLNLSGTLSMSCFSCVVQGPASSGIAINVPAGSIYWGYADFIVTPFLGGCWVTESGTIHIYGGTCANATGGAAASGITAIGTGVVTASNSFIAGGGTGGAWNCVAAAQCIDQGGNTPYTSAPIAVGNVTANFPVAYDVQASKAAAQVAKTIFTVGSSNTLFQANASLNCDSSSAAATVLITILYTDVSNTAETVASANATCTTLGTNSTSTLSTTFMAKAATVIQYSTTIANTPTYDVRVELVQMGLN